MSESSAGGRGLEPWKGEGGKLQVHLTGYMGAGKSTVGMRLARRLVWNFLDLDALVERHLGVPIASIFRDQGEAAFRQAEAFVLRQATQKPRTVLALGGGTLVDAANLELCRSTATIVWLRVSTAALRARLGPAQASRPLWRPEDLEDRLVQRQQQYECAEIVVDADGDPETVAAGVEQALLRYSSAENQ